MIENSLFSKSMMDRDVLRAQSTMIDDATGSVCMLTR